MPPLGTLMFWDSPLLIGTQITALIASLHPYFGTEFNRFDDAQDDTQIHLLTLVPTTASEAAFAQVHSVSALNKRWETASTPLFDVERAPAV